MAMADPPSGSHCGGPPAEGASQSPSRPKAASSARFPGRAPEPGGSRPCTTAAQAPVPACRPLGSRVWQSVQRCWKEMLEECREKDADRRGDIPAKDFFTVAERFHLNLTEEEKEQLTTKYDSKRAGRFAYCDFLQSCVLRLNQQDASPLKRTVIQHHPQMQTSFGPQSATFFHAMMRIQPRILHCWRPMRRTFKAYDVNGNGLLSIQDFRQVLRHYDITLSEEEFFHVLEYYDKTLTSKISYHEFLGAFLQ